MKYIQKNLLPSLKAFLLQGQIDKSLERHFNRMSRVAVIPLKNPVPSRPIIPQDKRDEMGQCWIYMWANLLKVTLYEEK